MLKAVLFDLDGTLLDTIPDIAGALNRSLAALGLPTHPVERCKSFVGSGIREAIRRAAPEGTGQETLERIHALYQADYPAHCADATAPYPGIRKMLEALEKKGLALGVLSNKTERTTQRIIAHYFPEINFRCVLGRTEGRPLKPDAGAAAPALAALGVSPGEIAYVGDSGTDMAFAKAVGMLPAGAGWGYRSREELTAQGAETVLGSAGELLEYLPRL